MNQRNLALCFLVLLFITAVFAGNKLPSRRRSPPPTTRTGAWCVARKDLSIKKSKNVVDVMCTSRAFGVDCNAIAPGHDCHFRKNYKKQASYVLNLFYINNHTCYAGYGTIAHRDPSEGKCQFPLSESTNQSLVSTQYEN